MLLCIPFMPGAMGFLDGYYVVSSDKGGESTILGFGVLGVAIVVVAK